MVINKTLKDEQMKSAEQIKEKYGKYYVPLTEANLNRVLGNADRSGYIIISASRASNTDSENKLSTNRLRQELTKRKYSFTPVFGGYQEENQDKYSLEYSFIVYPFNYSTKESIDFNEFKNDLMRLGRDFSQDSILVVEPGKNPTYVQCSDGVACDWNEFGFSDVKVNHPEDNEPYTIVKQYHKARKGVSPKRLSYVESFLNQQPDTIHDYGNIKNTGETCHLGRYDFDYKN